jgi:hypothetical protein
MDGTSPAPGNAQKGSKNQVLGTGGILSVGDDMMGLVLHASDLLR